MLQYLQRVRYSLADITLVAENASTSDVRPTRVAPLHIDEATSSFKPAVRRGHLRLEVTRMNETMILSYWLFLASSAAAGNLASALIVWLFGMFIMRIMLKKSRR